MTLLACVGLCDLYEIRDGFAFQAGPVTVSFRLCIKVEIVELSACSRYVFTVICLLGIYIYKLLLVIFMDLNISMYQLV